MMRYSLLLLISCISFLGCSQIDKMDKITTENAHLVTEYNEDDIESMVTYYFASRIRKDDDWKKVLPDPSRWSSRMQYSIKTHNQWNFVEFKNLGLYKGKYGSYVKVHITIEFEGRRDGGQDDVELQMENGRWIISKVPI